MAGIIEDFKLDMSDDHDITFAEAGEIVSIIIKTVIETSPGRMARQKVVNAFAKIIQNDFNAAEVTFLETLEKKDEIVKMLKDSSVMRRQRSMERNQKKFNALYNKYFN